MDIQVLQVGSCHGFSQCSYLPSIGWQTCGIVITIIPVLTLLADGGYEAWSVGAEQHSSEPATLVGLR